MKVIILTLIVLLCMLPATAHPAADSLRIIKAHYYATNDAIAQCQQSSGDDSDQCPYYHTTLIHNDLNKSVAGIGIWRRQIDFWYTHDDEFGTIHIQKITQTEDIAATRVYREWLFNDDNQLIFYYAQRPYEMDEIRLYFASDGTLVHAIPPDAETEVALVHQRTKTLLTIPQWMD